jgi:hypothetical protein
VAESLRDRRFGDIDDSRIGKMIGDSTPYPSFGAATTTFSVGRSTMMAASAYRRKQMLYSVVAVAFSYAVVLGIYLTPSRAFGLPDDAFALIIKRVSLVPSVVGQIAGFVVLLHIPEESRWGWWYAAVAALCSLYDFAV